MKASSPAPVSELFLGVWSLMVRKRVPLLVAAISFTMLLAVGSAAVQFRVLHIEDGIMSEFSLGRDELRTTIDEDFVAIGAMDVTEFMRVTNFGKDEFLQPQDGERKVGMTYLRRVSPIVFLQLGFNVLVMFAAAVFFLLLFTRGAQSPYDAAKRLPLFFVRMCGLLIWMLVRSFLWIPLLGPVIALYMLPRLSLAPVILASGEAGVFESLNLSMRRTSGHWISLFLRLVLIGIIALLLLWPMTVLVVGATLLSIKLGFFLLLLSLILTIAFQCAALTVLAAMMA